VTETETFNYREIHLQELRKQTSLNDVARVSGAPLLGVFETLAKGWSQIIPFGEVPNTPGIEAFLFEDVSFVEIG
jgi:hypothetical protein